MKFQDSSFNGKKVNVGKKKSVTQPRTHQKQYAPLTFQSWGHNKLLACTATSRQDRTGYLQVD